MKLLFLNLCFLNTSDVWYLKDYNKYSKVSFRDVDKGSIISLFQLSFYILLLFIYKLYQIFILTFIDHLENVVLINDCDRWKVFRPLREGQQNSVVATVVGQFFECVDQLIPKISRVPRSTLVDFIALIDVHCIVIEFQLDKSHYRSTVVI